MSFISIIMFFIKYGPSIFSLIKSAIELIQWLQDNDDEFVTLPKEVVHADLNRMAARSKKAKDKAELESLVERLKKRKAEVEGSKNA